MRDMIEDMADLLAHCKQEEDASTQFEDEIVNAQAESLKHYYGEPYGDEVPGRSQVVTREVFETIEWIRPDLVRTFTANGENLVEVEPTSPGDEQWAQMAGVYLNYIFFEDNDGERIVDSFAFDGLAQKLGVTAAYWNEPTYLPEETVSGINMMQVEALDKDPQIEVVSVTEEVIATAEVEMAPEAMGAMETSPQPQLMPELQPVERSFEVTYQRLDKPGLVKIVNVAPEDFRVGAGVVELDETCRYSARLVRTTRSDLKREYPEHAEEIEEYSGEGMVAEDDHRRYSRFRNNEYLDEVPSDEDLVMLEEYTMFDLDEDGFTEMVCVKRLGDMLLDVYEVDDHPFAEFVPIPMPHRLYGLSLADIVSDIQRINTVLLRAGLDSTYQSVLPRVAANSSTVNMADLLSPRAGGVIRVRGEPRANIMPVEVPDVSGPALQMMEFMNQIGESRSGITRNAQGIDPDALNKTATGIKLMQNAASTRKEMIARNLARGLKKLMRKVLRLVVTYQDQPRMIRVTGKMVPIDPRAWSAEMGVIVHPGVGTGDKDTRIGYLQMILAMQREIAQQAGMENMPLIMPKIRNTAERLVHEMGYRSADTFFPRAEQLQPPKPPQDPRVELEKQKMQMRAQEKQAQFQLEQQKMQADAQQAQADRMADAEMKREEMMVEMEIKREELAMEAQLKREQYAAELELKREQLIAELALKREFGTEGGTRPVQVGGEPG